MKTNKKLLNIFLVISIITLVSCEKQYDTDGKSKITYYADFTMNGDADVILPVGTAFTDPGVVAKEKGKEIPVTFSILGDYFSGPVGEVDVNKPDRYVITYAATNSDGFDGFIERSVYVFNTGDLVNSIEGLYTSSILRTGGAKPASYEDLAYVMIVKTGAKTYTISDAIGGFYSIGRGLGSSYNASNLEITANDIAGNDFDFNVITVGSWPEALTTNSMEVDPVKKTILIKSSWATAPPPYEFEITLTQVEL